MMLLQDPDQAGLIEQVARHQDQVVYDLPDAIEIAAAGSPEDTRDPIPLLQQELREIRSILSGNSRYQGRRRHPSSRPVAGWCDQPIQGLARPRLVQHLRADLLEPAGALLP